MGNNFTVKFYKEIGKDVDNNTLHCLCADCANEFYEGLELIDVAGSWDECGVCGIQNIPQWPSGYLGRDEYGEWK